MKVYLVKGTWIVNDNDDNEITDIYGVFSTMDEAEKIKEDLRHVIEEENLKEEVTIVEYLLDDPAELYYFMMNG